MLNDRLNMKLCRIAEQNKKLQQWLKKEREERWRKKVLEQQKRLIEEQQREERYRNFLEQVQRGDHPGLRTPATPETDPVTANSGFVFFFID